MGIEDGPAPDLDAVRQVLRESAHPLARACLADLNACSQEDVIWFHGAASSNWEWIMSNHVRRSDTRLHGGKAALESMRAYTGSRYARLFIPRVSSGLPGSSEHDLVFVEDWTSLLGIFHNDTTAPSRWTAREARRRWKRTGCADECIWID